MLVLLVYGSDPVLRPAVKELWPFSRRLMSAHSTQTVSGTIPARMSNAKT